VKWNLFSKRKPCSGSSVLAKTSQNIIIPCIYENETFIKIHVWSGKLERFCSISQVVEWAYEINPNRKEVGVSEITLRALHILCRELREDPEVFDFYQANIAMAFMDVVDKKKKTNKNLRFSYPTLELLANEAATNFLKIFVQESILSESILSENTELKECTEEELATIDPPTLPPKRSTPKDLGEAIARAISQTNVVRSERHREQLMDNA